MGSGGGSGDGTRTRTKESHLPNPKHPRQEPRRARLHKQTRTKSVHGPEAMARRLELGTRMYSYIDNSKRRLEDSKTMRADALSCILEHVAIIG